MSVHSRSVRSLSHARLGPVELITGGLLSTAAALAMAGPLIAALLIRHSGRGTEPVAPLILLSLAVVVAITAALTMFAIARRRRR
ncbi:hypothetical protein AB0H20_23550 [Nocardia fluminea]|jgi:uncharacterized membrane protein YdcZ (DUF606 family)|uniref:hypothetical protein n=1 Tax=Nocardia fluminea TaxID=134984 RepID=UPI0033D9D9E4